MQYSADYSNTYYHLDSSHIQRKNPLFNGKVYIDFVKYQTIDSGQRTVISQSNFEVILLHWLQCFLTCLEVILLYIIKYHQV